MPTIREYLTIVIDGFSPVNAQVAVFLWNSFAVHLICPCLGSYIFDFIAVKLWYTNMEHSVASLEAKANVCCVKFDPDSRYHLAFGSAGTFISMLDQVVMFTNSNLYSTILLIYSL